MHYVNEPTPGSLADLQDDADPEQVARTILLRRLSVAPRTRRELADDLRKRGIPDDVSARVLDRFEEVGLVDDTEFARMWAVSRQRTKGSARSVLQLCTTCIEGSINPTIRKSGFSGGTILLRPDVSSDALRILVARAGSTGFARLNKLDTGAVETPARHATSLIEAGFLAIRQSSPSPIATALPLLND